MFGHTPPAEVPLATTVIVVLPPENETFVEMLPFDQMSQPLSCAPPVECVIDSASNVCGVHEPPLVAPAVPPTPAVAPEPAGPVAPPPGEPLCVTVTSCASFAAPPGEALNPKEIEPCAGMA